MFLCCCFFQLLWGAWNHYVGKIALKILSINQSIIQSFQGCLEPQCFSNWNIQRSSQNLWILEKYNIDCLHITFYEYICLLWPMSTSVPIKFCFPPNWTDNRNTRASFISSFRIVLYLFFRNVSSQYFHPITCNHLTSWILWIFFWKNK